MTSQKLENLLNLALNSAEDEREKSLNLNVGYDPLDREWDLIIKYSVNLDRVRKIAVSYTHLDVYKRQAFTGAVSHFAIGGMPNIAVWILCIVFTLLWARIAAVFANKATPKTLNRATGVILVVLGIVVMAFSILN